MMTFASAVWLPVGLAVALALLAGMLLEDRARRRALASLVTPSLARELVGSRSTARRWLKRAALLAGTASLFMALARPQWGFRWEPVKRQGIDVLFAVDTSKSMLARDVAPDRLERAKLAIRDLVEAFPDDRVGLVAFAGSAFLQTPLTLDHGAFERSLDAVDVGIIPRGGTDVAAAIEAGREALSKSPENERLFVLLTDGEDLGGAALEAAERAAGDGVRIFTVGVGTPSGELVPVADGEGRTSPLRDEEGEVVTSRLDEPLLRQIAEKTGGHYHALAAGGASLASLYGDELARLEKAERSGGRRQVPIERFQWPLALSLVLLGLEPFIGELRRRRVPRTSRALWRRSRALGQAPAAAAVTLALLASSTAHASPADAARALERGDFEASASAFAEAARKNPDDPRLPYNQAVAAYRAGRFEDAASAFESALQTGRLDVQQRAYYDLGNARFRLGELFLEKDRAATRETWKRAASAYEAALALDPGDADARHNLDLVLRRLAALEEEPQEQKEAPKQDPNEGQQQGDQKDPNEGQKEQNESEQQGDQKDSNDGQKGEPQDQNDGQKGDRKDSNEGRKDPNEGQKGDQKGEEQGQKGEQQDQSEGQRGDPKDQNDGQKDERKDPKGSEGDGQGPQGGEPSKAPGEAGAGVEPAEKGLSREQAEALLDSVAGDLRLLPMAPGGAASASSEAPAGKDW